MFLYCTGLFQLSRGFCISIWNLVLFFWGLWRIVLGFWCVLHWIFRLLLVWLPFFFTMLILPFHEHEESFHFLISSLISLFRFKVLVIQIFRLAQVTPRYFMLFVAIEKGDISLISISAYLLSVYRRATDFFWVKLVYCHTEGVYQL